MKDEESLGASEDLGRTPSTRCSSAYSCAASDCSQNEVLTDAWLDKATATTLMAFSAGMMRCAPYSPASKSIDILPLSSLRFPSTSASKVFLKIKNAKIDTMSESLVCWERRIEEVHVQHVGRRLSSS
jgi:hypothetical protein